MRISDWSSDVCSSDLGCGGPKDKPRPMSNQFFERPILNSPYDYPKRHWELDESGQPTQLVKASRRTAEFFTPIPKPRKRKGKAEQRDMLFDEDKGHETTAHPSDPTTATTQTQTTAYSD